MSWDWLLPEGLEPAEIDRLNREQGVKVLTEDWPRTPLPYLKGRTPLQAAEAGDAKVALRAAVFQLEATRDVWRDAVDFDALRRRLRIEPEPAIDPETVDIEQIHLSRLALVPVDRLDDDRLAALYRRSRRFMLVDVIERTARALLDRPAARERGGINMMMIHADLASIEAEDGRIDKALEWIARGRQADSPAERARNAVVWDLQEIRLRARAEAPESWVPDLAVLLERYEGDPEGVQALLLGLTELGLVQLLPNPDQPGEIMVDTRPLQALLDRYGPRVKTASGRLGVSATKGGLWTPGGPSTSAGGGAAIWTPGSESAPPAAGGEKPRLIIPG
jgi:hypothetical protein